MEKVGNVQTAINMTFQIHMLECADGNKILFTNDGSGLKQNSNVPTR